MYRYSDSAVERSPFANEAKHELVFTEVAEAMNGAQMSPGFDLFAPLPVLKRGQLTGSPFASLAALAFKFVYLQDLIALSMSLPL